MKKRLSVLIRVLACVVFSFLFFVIPVKAQIIVPLYTVNTTSDAVVANACFNGTAGCSLRGAITQANTVSDSVIAFAIPASDPFCSGGICTISLTSALPSIGGAGLFRNISIEGPGADRLTVRSAAGVNVRVFDVTSVGTVTFFGLTISDGHVINSLSGAGIQTGANGTVNVTNCTFNHNISDSGGGGGIAGHGSNLTVTNSTFIGNSAAIGGAMALGGLVNVNSCTLSGNSSTGSTGSGGGIAYLGRLSTLTITNTILNGNFTAGVGGGIVIRDGTVNVINSTISRGSGGAGGGISNDFIPGATVTLNVVNSTISNNQSTFGGGIDARTGTVNLTNSTISGNISTSNNGGGGIIKNPSNTVNVKSTIIALNTGAGGAQDVSGDFVSAGFNLIGKSDGSTGFTAATDQTGTIAAPLNPMLDPAGLQNNGGPTMTIALQPGSPAIDKGTSAGPTGNLTTDQRGTGFPRTINDPLITNATGGDGTDIGAFEKQTITPTLQFSSATYSVNENAGTATITVTRANDPSVAATVNYATSNGTATAGADYTATSGTLSFASGDTSKTFSIPIINDSLNETNETVNLTLNNVTGNAALGAPSTAVLTIVDDDPLPGLSINDVSVAEGNSGTTNANFTVSLSAASGQTVTVNFASANGTATAGSDYVATSGTLTFTAGQTTKPVTVTVNGDTTVEPDETFFVDLSSPANATLTRSRGTGTITNDDAAPTPNVVQFSSSNYGVTEDCTTVTITVNRIGDTTGAATVDYFTSDVTASERRDYITALGKLQFAPGETSKSFAVLINEDSYVEGTETFNVNLTNPSGVSLGSPAIATVQITDDASEPATNVIDDPQNFVCQHYHDFLNRAPDSGGLAFWTNEITSCGANQACIELKRINVSAAFYLSIEFQDTGYLVERIYKAAYGNANGTSTFGGAHQLPVPIVRLNEFLFDTQKIGQGVIVGQGNWQQQLEDNKNAFTAEFVQRSRFTTAFPQGMTPAQFVDTLNANAGNPLSQSERDQLVNDLTTNAKTRAQVLRAVAEDSDLNSAEFNRAFVLMQYLGYLRRNPNDPQDTDYTGYDFWLTKLNQFNGNFVNAEMVKAFIVSGEYRNRFGP